MPVPSATISNVEDSVKIVVIGADDSEVPRAVAGTVSVSPVAAGYIAKAGPGEFYYKAYALPTTPGVNIPVTVTFSCVDAASNPLPPLVANVILAGPPLPPNATHLNITEGPTTGRYPVLADPLSGTISY